jgi:hypothetical protein
MQSNGRFSWQLNGPRDYSEAVKILALRGAEERRTLNGRQSDALAHILQMFAKAARDRSHVGWLTFSRDWLARVLHCSLSTVGRILHTLRALGYISRRRRVPVGGRNQSALTKVGTKLLSLLYRTAQVIKGSRGRGAPPRAPLPRDTQPQKLQQKHDRSKVTHNDLKKRIEAPDMEGGASYSSSGMEERACEESLQGSAPATSTRFIQELAKNKSWSAEWNAEQKAKDNARRAELKRQATLLLSKEG